MTRLHAAMLRAASLLVPGPLRAEWLAEWNGELWHVKQKATLFCLGSLRDALWLRRNAPTPNTRRTFGLESPLRCLLSLTILTAASVFFAFRLPFPRQALLPSPYADARDLVTIAADGQFSAKVPTVPIEQYRALADHLPRIFAGLAFYRPVRARVRETMLPIAVASANLFELLGIPPSPAGPVSLVLSRDAWREHFARDPHIVGSRVEVDGRAVVVAGVLPATAWQLPGRAEAWLLEDDLQVPSRARGFLLGRVSPSSPHETDLPWRFTVGNEPEGILRFQCTSLAKPYFVTAYLFMCGISLLMLWAFTPLTLGEYPANRHATPLAVRLRRWIFFGAKIALVLPLAFFGSLDLASIIAPGLQPHALIIGLIAGLRWALTDQRQRCPVCLRLLTNPIRIGGPAQIFLDWYGTELMCAHGHGMLYVPEIVTSSYGAPRWQYLDPSWSSLFS